MFSLFINHEFFFYNEINEINENLTEKYKDKDKDICFICWLPAEKNNIIKKLPDFSHINIICKCKPNIHQLCLNDWISKNSSCPICRTKFNPNQHFLTRYNFVELNIYTIKLICYINLIYFIYIFINNIYIIIFFDDHRYVY